MSSLRSKLFPAVLFALLQWPVTLLADTGVRVNVPSPETILFLVNVSTHHSDLHNGYSRTRFEELLVGNETHRIPVGLYLNRSHYSAWTYHPDYMMASVRSEGRWSSLPDLEPLRWVDLLRDMNELPITGHGPTFARAVDSAVLYRDHYLPALDRAGVAPAEDILARLQAFLERTEKLAGASPQEELSRDATVLRLIGQRDRAMSELARLLQLKRKARIAMREFKAVTLGPRPMIQALQREPGFARVPRYLASLNDPAVAQSKAEPPSWEGESVDVQFSYTRSSYYRLRVDESPEPLPCYRGAVQFDGRHLSAGLFPELRDSVATDFCRHADGKWRLRSRWAD